MFIFSSKLVSHYILISLLDFSILLSGQFTFWGSVGPWGRQPRYSSNQDWKCSPRRPEEWPKTIESRRQMNTGSAFLFMMAVSTAALLSTTLLFLCSFTRTLSPLLSISNPHHEDLDPDFYWKFVSFIRDSSVVHSEEKAYILKIHHHLGLILHFHKPFFPPYRGCQVWSGPDPSKQAGLSFTLAFVHSLKQVTLCLSFLLGIAGLWMVVLGAADVQRKIWLLAETFKSRDIVVKFTTHYGTTPHSLLAEDKLAPQLYYSDKVGVTHRRDLWNWWSWNILKAKPCTKLFWM